ncbi:MAG TPA: hypothetical protein VLM85_15055 [Polyangiaceae bacterium]|nr:hypothetical protein [Polyangiaceae bacterium]
MRSTAQEAIVPNDDEARESVARAKVGAALRGNWLLDVRQHSNRDR